MTASCSVSFGCYGRYVSQAESGSAGHTKLVDQIDEQHVGGFVANHFGPLHLGYRVSRTQRRTAPQGCLNLRTFTAEDVARTGDHRCGITLPYLLPKSAKRVSRGWFHSAIPPGEPALTTGQRALTLADRLAMAPLTVDTLSERA